MIHLMRIVFWVLVAATLLGCSTTVAPSQALGRSPNAVPSLDDTLDAINPKVTVVPSGPVTDGQTVTISVTGFSVGGKVFLSECATAADATSLGCGAQLAAQPFLVTDDARAGSGRFVVRATAAATALDGPMMPCTAQCVLVATLGDGFPFAIGPLTFGIP